LGSFGSGGLSKRSAVMHDIQKRTAPEAGSAQREETEGAQFSESPQAVSA
jgi:hypothetical protein